MSHQSTPSHLADQVTFPQVLVEGHWRDVRALFERVGGKGYSTVWWTLDDSGHVTAESVGYHDRAFRRMLEEGRARFQSPEEREAWADDESARRLIVDELIERRDRPGDRPRLRRVEPAPTTREALRRLLHVRGTQWQEHTGEDWDTHRHALITELCGEDKSSKDLTSDELSILVDWVATALDEAGFDLKAADAEYQRRQDARANAFGEVPA